MIEVKCIDVEISKDLYKVLDETPGPQKLDIIKDLLSKDTTIKRTKVHAKAEEWLSDESNQLEFNLMTMEEDRPRSEKSVLSRYYYRGWFLRISKVSPVNE